MPLSSKRATQTGREQTKPLSIDEPSAEILLHFTQRAERYVSSDSAVLHSVLVDWVLLHKNGDLAGLFHADSVENWAIVFKVAAYRKVSLTTEWVFQVLRKGEPG